ncbi:MAG: hypothetical protein ABFS10_15545, partial [Bacteroidota bacterium]
AMEGISSISDTARLLKYVNKFEKIGNKYPGHWIPYYYASEALTAISLFEDKGSKKDAHLERAQVLHDNALALAPEESEIFVLQAVILSSMIMVDPKIRAVIHYSNANAALHKAKELNPGNPRVYFIDGMTKTVLPEFLGGGPEQAKEQFLVAEEKFEAFENDDPFWPGWGEKMNNEQLEKLADVELEE